MSKEELNIREDNGNGADSVSLSGEDSAVINCENSTITGENSVVNETPTEIPPASPLLQYTSNTSTGFVDICNCLIYEKLRCDETCASSLVINEATTGYLDVATGQSTGSFVTYVIEFGEWKGRKRYSDFELLAAHLNRVYPHQVIPPIPEKESLTSIISGYTGLRDKHDPFLIQHRTRLFQSFLVNVRQHGVLSGDHFFHRFLDPKLNGPTWSEGITTVPARLLDGGDLSAATSSEKGKIPDPLLVRLEEMTLKYREGIKSIERGQSKLLKKLKDESNVLSELGAGFNAFSLEVNEKFTNEPLNSTNQNEPLNYTNQNEFSNSTNQNEPSNSALFSFKAQLEMIGKSSDSEVLHLHSLIRHHELLRDRLQEIILYCGSVLRSLSNLNRKRASLEDFHDQINGRKNMLMQMETCVRADEEGDVNLKKLKRTIEELENSKKTKLSEMSEFSHFLLSDVSRVYRYFGNVWRTCLKALAHCQSQWHEEAIKSWKLNENGT